MEEKLYMGWIMVSPIENEMIHGPLFSLKIEKTQKIVDFLSQSNRWNTEYLQNNAQILPPEILFESLKVFSNVLLNNKLIYVFNIFQVHEYFNIVDFCQLEKRTFLALSAFSKLDNSLVYSNCLGFVSNQMILDLYEKELTQYGSIPIDASNSKLFLSRKETKVFYSFDFDCFYYTVHPVNLQSYLLRESEDWFKVDDVGFFPLNFINN